MNVDIISETADGWNVSVAVQGAQETMHNVHVATGYYERLGNGRSVEEFVRESFEFLLKREPNTSILREFDISVIQEYFSEYEETI